jgi:hypothetical protein
MEIFLNVTSGKKGDRFSKKRCALLLDAADCLFLDRFYGC